MKNNALILFVRNPILGKVKTRLAKTIGDEKTLEIYKDLLFHTMSQTKNLDCDKYVFYDNVIENNDIWSEKLYYKNLQSGVDLGERMNNAFKYILNLGYNNCVIIGSDLLDLEYKHIEIAFEKLEKNDIVIGPAEDGGYYLLGMKKLYSEIFENKIWGTSTVLKDTLKDLKEYKIDFLEILNDIDTFEDLEKNNYYLKQK